MIINALPNLRSRCSNVFLFVSSQRNLFLRNQRFGKSSTSTSSIFANSSPTAMACDVIAGGREMGSVKVLTFTVMPDKYNKRMSIMRSINPSYVNPRKKTWFVEVYRGGRRLGVLILHERFHHVVQTPNDRFVDSKIDVSETSNNRRTSEESNS